jgi:SAM-dependent methyltransferase
MNKIKQSYLRQVKSESEMELPSRYTSPSSVDNWRHTRMLALTKPIWELFPKSKWITIGDGRYGSDAAYLHSQGVDVISTTLTDKKLKYAYEKGFIPAYQAENAEHISLKDDSIDFVLCKEAYHHFPRPPIALYEMLRVSRIAIILIEPLENPKLLDSFKRLLKKLLRGDKEMQFEPSGNFLYRLNIRELEKLLTAMGGEDISFKGINDFYHSKLSGYEALKWNFGFIFSYTGIFIQDTLVKLGLLGYGLGCVVIFKKNAPPEYIKSLNKAGFKHIQLAKNPYT